MSLNYDPEKLDPGIRPAVELLNRFGVETFESCEGGEGHSFPEPTVRFHGDAGEGYRAVGILLSHGFPVTELRRMWGVEDSWTLTGPYWEVVFLRKLNKEGMLLRMGGRPKLGEPKRVKPYIPRDDFIGGEE